MPRINVIAFLFTLLCAGPAQAGICLGLNVSANPLVLGSYLPANGASASTDITISCLLGLSVLPSFTVALSSGMSGTPAQRTLVMGTSRLNYNLYTTGGFGAIWGDGTAGSTTVGYNGVLLQLGNTAFTAYGLAPSGQYVASGIYHDTVMVTVNF